MGRKDDAMAVVANIFPDMEIIENMSYHSLDMFYRGDLSFEELVGDREDSPAGSAVLYGAANWLYCEGETDDAVAMLEQITSAKSWAGFGFIAAEADLAALR